MELHIDSLRTKRLCGTWRVNLLQTASALRVAESASQRERTVTSEVIQAVKIAKTTPPASPTSRSSISCLALVCLVSGASHYQSKKPKMSKDKLNDRDLFNLSMKQARFLSFCLDLTRGPASQSSPRGCTQKIFISCMFTLLASTCDMDNTETCKHNMLTTDAHSFCRAGHPTLNV